MGDQNSQQRIDQRDQDVVTYQNFRGLRSNVDPERFELADLYSAVNVDLDASGRLSRRAGYTSVATGAVHSLWADETQQLCLYAAGSQLYQLAATYAGTALRTLVGAGLKLSYARVGDRVYFSNGIDLGVVEAGVARTWGLPVPALPTPTGTVGSLPAGTYQFALTWVRGDGQESGAPLAGAVTLPAGSGLNFMLPTPIDPGITAQRLYLSTANGEELYLAAELAATEILTSYTGDTLELTLPLATQFLSAPPAGQLLGYYRGHLFVAVGDTLCYSQPHAYELFDLRDYITLDGQVTLMTAMEDKERSGEGQHSGFFIGTDRSCGVLVGSSPADFQYVPKTNYGALLGAMTMVDGALFGDNSAGARNLPVWLTTQGICAGTPDMEIRNLTRTKYSFPATGQGAAVFVAGPNRFISTCNF